MKTSWLSLCMGAAFACGAEASLIQTPHDTGYLDVATYKRERPQDMQVMQLFLPLGHTQRKDDLWFLDLRTQDREGAAFEGNVGLGYRRLVNHHEWGGFAYWDKRKTFSGNTFKQGTLGAEWQTKHTAWHGNVYIPLGKKKSNVDGAGGAELRDGTGGFKNIWFSNGVEHMLAGGDLEYGQDVSQGLRAYAGVYCFGKSGIRTAIGPRVSLRYRPFVKGAGSNLTFDALWRYDRLQRHTWHVGMTYRFWLGAHEAHHDLRDVMTDTVRRDLDIVTRGQNTAYQPLKVGNDVLKLKEATNESELAPAGAHVVYVKNDITLTAPLVLTSGEILTGLGYVFDAGGQRFSLGAGSVTLTAAPGQNALTLADNNTVEHVVLTVDNDADRYAMQASAATFNTTVHHVTTNGRLSFKATGTGTSHLNFHDNTVNYHYTSGTAGVDATSGTHGRSVLFVDAEGDDSKISVDDFYGNSVISDAKSVTAWRNMAHGQDSVVLFVKGAHDNHLEATTQGLHAWVNLSGGQGAAIDFVGNVSDNEITVRNDTGIGVPPAGMGMWNWALGVDSEVGFANFKHNSIGAGTEDAMRNLAGGVGSTVAFAGDFSDNTMDSEGSVIYNEAGAQDSDIVFQSMKRNTLKTVEGSGESVLWNRASGRNASITYLGDLQENVLAQTNMASNTTAINNEASNENSHVFFTKALQNNHFVNVASGEFTAIAQRANDDGAAIVFSKGLLTNTFVLGTANDIAFSTYADGAGTYATQPKVEVLGFSGNQFQKQGSFVTNTNMIHVQKDTHAIVQFDVLSGGKTVPQANPGMLTPTHSTIGSPYS